MSRDVGSGGRGLRKGQLGNGDWGTRVEKGLRERIVYRAGDAYEFWSMVV